MATYTEAEKAAAVALAIEHGLAQAVERTGYPKQTISGWMSPEQRTQMHGHSEAKTRAAITERQRKLDQRRMDLAESLMDDAVALRLQLFAPCVERKAMVVAGGHGNPSSVEIVDIDHDQPTFRDQQTIVTTLAITVDKIQVLTGQPSAITGHVGAPERTPEQEQELARVLHLVDHAA